MKRVGRDATLDEASVSHAYQRAGEWRRPRAGGTRTPAAPVTHITVQPEVWAAAQSALRPGQRIVIINERCVRIINE